jgi:hypothetical protein
MVYRGLRALFTCNNAAWCFLVGIFCSILFRVKLEVLMFASLVLCSQIYVSYNYLMYHLVMRFRGLAYLQHELSCVEFN